MSAPSTQLTGTTFMRTVPFSGGSPKHLRAAFTLVELLVVIAIIGVLAGLLLPTLARARVAGRSAACMGNLRQLLTAEIMYVSENQGYLTYPNWAHDRNATNVWANGWLAGRRSDGRHQLFAVAATCADMCHGLMEATVAMRVRCVRLTFTPDHSWPRAKEAMIVAHSSSSNRKKPGCPLLPDVALTQ